MADYEDLPLVVLKADGNRALLLEALEKAYLNGPVDFYDKYAHSRRGKFDENIDDEFDLATRSPAEEAALIDEQFRKKTV